LEERNIQGEEMLPWHIEQTLHQGWQGWFNDFIQGSSQRINADFNPIGVFYSISHWNAVFAPSLRPLFSQLERINLRIIVLVLIGFQLLYFSLKSIKIRIFQTGIPLTIFTTGFAGMVFDLMLIFAFQSIYGHVFSWIGLLVASFMAGAACGALLIAVVLERIKHPFKIFSGIELAIMVFSIGCLGIIVASNRYLGSPEAFFTFKVLFLAISFLSGLLIGSQFPLANKLYLRDSTSLTTTAGLLYSSDLLGGWLGGILGAVVLLPVLGLVGTCITVGLLKLTSWIVINTQPNQGFRGGNHEG
jgi:spermidine synthase